MKKCVCLEKRVADVMLESSAGFSSLLTYSRAVNFFLPPKERRATIAYYSTRSVSLPSPQAEREEQEERVQASWRRRER
jgi:hypothetical protein